MKNYNPYCPFCGSLEWALLKSDDEGPGGGPDYFVLCQRCRAGGPQCKSEEAALSGWSVRIVPPKPTLSPSES